MNPAGNHQARQPILKLLGPVIIHPAAAGRLPFVVFAAFGLSLWQMADSLQKLVPVLPKALAGLLQLAGGLTGLAVILTAPGLLMKAMAASGNDGMKKWSAKYFRDQAEDIFKTSLKAAVAALWSFLPLGLYFILTSKDRGLPSPWMAAFLFLLSLLYFPMALRMLAVTGKLMPSLLVSNVLERMVRYGISYFKTLPLFWLLLLLPLPGLLLWRIPFAGPLASSFLLLYSWLCAFRWLGASFDMAKDITETKDEDR